VHHTSPLGPQFHTAPVLRSLENCQLILECTTSTPNDTRASAWPPRKATLAQDPGAISPSDEDDIFHPVDLQSFVPDPGEPEVDMLDHPLAKTFTHYGILALGLYWKG
jgi:hypothetical protein